MNGACLLTGRNDKFAKIENRLVTLWKIVIWKLNFVDSFSEKINE